MANARHTADTAKADVTDALADGKRKAAGDHAPAVVGPHAVLALQRNAGNAAVSALITAKRMSPRAQAVTEIDAALTEVRRDDPAIDTVETGLKAAKATGVPVDLEGPKPPPSALAVTRTGFGPESVPAKKPVPPTKPVPAVSPLGRVGAVTARAGGRGTGTANGRGTGTANGRGTATATGTAPTAAPAGGGGAPAIGPAPPAGDEMLRPPVPPRAARPEDDTSFTRVTGDIRGVAKDKKAHPPAASKAKEAQDAAVAPADDLTGQAKAAKVDTMDAQQAGSFDKKAFIAAVKAAIEAKSPKTLKEADDYTASGKAGEVKGEVKSLVTQGTDDQGRDIEAATEAPPDQSKAIPKPVTPMAEERPGQPAAIPAAGAVPKPAPNEQVNLAAGTHEVNEEMAEAEVTEPQLAQSNEPQFQQALTDKQAAAAHADTAPAQFRQHEQAVIERGRAEAAEETTAAVAGMQGAEGTALAKLVADKGKTRSRDEAKRAEVTAKVQSIFAATEADVRKILDGIDPKVEAAFDQGEAAARSAFETYVAAKMSAYKKDRYGGWLGGLRWAKDKLLGMPAKVNEFYEAGREVYLKQMDGVISRVADIVGNDLAAAKKRIATGKAEIASYVKGLPADLQKVGAEASKEIGDSFSQLERDVDAKQESIVDSLATKYVEARKGLDERIEALQAENRGLVDKAIGAIKAVINTIRELAAMLRNVLARAAGVVGAIIKDPVGFLSNLIAGIKGGILKFKDNILTHLRRGLMGWLFGALAEGGVELPDSFDVKGIIKLLASIFGMTWANIRNRIVKRIGEKATAAAEKGVEIFQLIAGQGVAGLWQMLVDKLGDIREMILEQVKDLVITKIITAGITWLIGLLNPAAAFIKACKLIYDVVMFFVSNAGRIMRFVNTVIDSVADIVRGNVSGVVNKINDVLGQMVPIIIGFLASLIGLGGIGQRVRQIMETLRKPFTKALDFAINTGLKLAGPIIRGLKGVSGRVKAKVAAGKAWVKGKAAAGKEWVKGKVDAGKAKIRERFSGEEGDAGVVSEAPAQDAAKPLDVGFEMSGKSHTIHTTTGPNPQITMHSALGGDLLAKIQSAMRAPGVPPDQLAALADLERKARAFRMLVIRHNRAKTQVPPGTVEVTSLISALTTYATTYHVDDLDPLSAGGAALRSHAGYTWLTSHGLAESFDARILAHLENFGMRKVTQILDVIARLGTHPAFLAKVQRAVDSNRFWSPNNGFFFEIGDLHDIQDIRFMDVSVGGRVIDVLTGDGRLIDQKYTVSLAVPPTPGTVPALNARLVAQCTAMQGAVGSTVMGIPVTAWEIHYAQPLTDDVRAAITASGWDANFQQGRTARAYL